MTQASRIKAMEIEGLVPRCPPTIEPRFETVDPRLLCVDHTYQRTVGRRGTAQIKRIIEEFCWTKFKPPICAFADQDGQRVLKVLDGQHTAVAAASNPFITFIPVMVVEAPETAQQAAAFVGQNTSRLAITPLQLHHAATIAGDEDAQTVELVCARAGVKIVRGGHGRGGRHRPRETVAIKAIRALVDNNTAAGARRILEVLANADLAPITAPQLRAAEFLMTDPEHCHRFEPEDLTAAIADMFLVAEDEAKILAHAHRMAFWRALATVWFRKTKKKKRFLRAAA